MKRFSTIMLCVVMLFSLATSACASENGYTDVSENEWYAEAVMALREKGIILDNRSGIVYTMNNPIGNDTSVLTYGAVDLRWDFAFIYIVYAYVSITVVFDGRRGQQSL